MAKSPLTLYKEVVKEYAITEDEQVSPVARLSYVQSQLQEQKQILNRLLFDVATAEHQKQGAQDQLSRDAFRKKSDNYRNDIYQILDAIRVNAQLIEEIRKEHPELQTGA